MSKLIEKTVLQNTNGRSAQYEVHVIKNGGKYSVATLWGAIGTALQKSVITETESLNNALNAAMVAANKKKARGYREILKVQPTTVAPASSTPTPATKTAAKQQMISLSRLLAAAAPASEFDVGM